jgi:hypothetical protein
MSPEEVALLWHEQSFRLACHEKTGVEFQGFFEAIMEKADDSFVKVKPSGSEGDWKCDGYSADTAALYQVYAPGVMKVKDAANKIKDDFAGALKHWKEPMKGWIFVWSAEKALAPQIAALILALQNSNDSLAIDHWGREQLWKKLEGLTERQRSTILGPAPVPSMARTVTAAEVQTLLSFVAAQPIPEPDQDLELTDLTEKMDRNDFSDGTRALIAFGLPVATSVRDYVDGNHDISFSSKVADALGAMYARISPEYPNEKDLVFALLVGEVAAGAGANTKEYWAALGIVSYYFELCDIFER